MTPEHSFHIPGLLPLNSSFCAESARLKTCFRLTLTHDAASPPLQPNHEQSPAEVPMSAGTEELHIFLPSPILLSWCYWKVKAFTRSFSLTSQSPKPELMWQQAQRAPCSSGSVQGKGAAPLLTPLQGNIFPAGAGHRQKAQETHQAWYVGTKCKHLSLSAFSRQNTARCTCVGWSVVAPRSSLWSVMSNCALWCWHLPEQRTQLIISAKDVLPIPLGKQIFVLSEAIPLLLLQNYQLWPLKPCHKGMNYLYFFLFFLNKGSNYPP